MKKYIVLLVLAAAAFGYYRVRAMRIDFSWARGETVVVKRGDLVVPITATGEIAPLSRHQIKSEASGEVIEILHDAGDVVKKGDLLLRLKKDDEQRSVDRARADVTRTRATLDSARIKKEKLETTGIKQAELQIQQMQAQFDQAEFNFKKIEDLYNKKISQIDEYTRANSSYREAKARLEAAQADLQDAQISVKLAAEDIKLAEAAFEQMQTAFRDAEQRLAETDVFCPVDGMVVALETQVGEVIQSGKTTFTGGTILAAVADISKLYVHAGVDEADIGAVCNLAPEWARPGAERLAANEKIPFESTRPVKVRVESFHDEEFEGIIERIHPEPNSKKTSVVTYQVDILLTSDNRNKLLAGMQADVEFVAKSVENVVLVPHEAIRKNDFDELGVFVVVTKENSERDKKFVRCTFGLDNGMFAEVIDGVSEGAEIYTVLPQKTTRDGDSKS